MNVTKNSEYSNFLLQRKLNFGNLDIWIQVKMINWPVEHRWCGRPCNSSCACTGCKHRLGSYCTRHTSVYAEPAVYDAVLWSAPGAQCCQSHTQGSTVRRQHEPIGRHSSAWRHRHELDTCSMRHRQLYLPDIVDTATGPRVRTVRRSIPGERQGCTNRRTELHWH